MPVPKNLVWEQSSSTGTGNKTLVRYGGFARVSEAFGTGDAGSANPVLFFANKDATSAEWEVVQGYMSDANTFVPVTVLDSSNSGSAVTFTAGLKHVTNDIHAAYQVYNPNATVTDGHAVVFDGTTGRQIKSAGSAPYRVGGTDVAVADGGTGSSTAAGARTNLDVYNAVSIYGLTLSNNGTDAVNDIDIAAGRCSQLSDAAPLVLASTLTKRLDAAWAVGSGNGGRDTGSIADGTWHVWLIKRSDTGVVDALFSTSATSPTMPSNYDIKRRIGSVIRTSGTLNGLTQIEDHFYYGATDRNDTSAVSNTLLTLTVPTGIKVRPILNFSVAATGSANITVTVNNGDLATSNQTILQVRDGGTQVKQFRNNTSSIWTNTSGQIRFTQSNNTGTPDTSSVYTAGWIDPRM